MVLRPFTLRMKIDTNSQKLLNGTARGSGHKRALCEIDRTVPALSQPANPAIHATSRFRKPQPTILLTCIMTIIFGGGIIQSLTSHHDLGPATLPMVASECDPKHEKLFGPTNGIVGLYYAKNVLYANHDDVRRSREYPKTRAHAQDGTTTKRHQVLNICIKKLLQPEQQQQSTRSFGPCISRECDGLYYEILVSFQSRKTHVYLLGLNSWNRHANWLAERSTKTRTWKCLTAHIRTQVKMTYPVLYRQDWAQWLGYSRKVQTLITPRLIALKGGSW